MTRELEYYYAVRENDLEKLSALASEEDGFCAKIKPYNQSLLLHAAFNGGLAVTRFLLDHDCPVDEADGSGYTPLHGAVEYDHTDIVRLLLDHGAGIDAEDRYGNTPLLNAVLLPKAKIDMIRLLVDRDADPEHANKAGVTPLSFAEKTGKKEIADYLRLHKKNDHQTG
jgi:ankyrin repeat protein